MSILVIDDNTLLLSKIVRSLLKANHTVRSATSLMDARQILQQEIPQVLCLDLQLPDGNGLDLVQELRNSGRKIPVVIISGQYSEAHRKHAEQLGVAQFISKPFALQDLHAVLRKLLDNSEPSEDVTFPNQAELKQETKDTITIEAIAPSRITRAKRAYTTRHVTIELATHLVSGDYHPQVGDLVLAKVDKRNQHKHIQLPAGRRSLMFPGDEIIVCYGNRYAPDQFEAEIPEDLSPCHLVAAGGIASASLSRNSKMQPATIISPIGVLADSNGKVLNMKDFGLKANSIPNRIPPVTVVLGTSMNAGKTTVAADLILGMTRQGLKVGAAKVTGTGAGGDVWRMVDAGGYQVLDFTDFGVPSTYKVPVETCIVIMETLIAQLCETDVDSIVIEIADGILQAETRGLIQSPAFSRLVDNVIFAAGDAMGALGGTTWLKEQNLNVVGVSGVITGSPLAVREFSAVTELPVFSRTDLNSGQYVSEIFGHSVTMTDSSVLNSQSA